MFNTPQDKRRLLDRFQERLCEEGFRKHYGAFLFPIVVQAELATRLTRRSFPHTMPFGWLFQNWTADREFEWSWMVHDMQMVRRKLFESLEADPLWGSNFVDQYMRGFHAFDIAATREEPYDIETWTNEDIVDHLVSLIESTEAQALGYAVDALLATANDDWFSEWVGRYLKGRSVSAQDIGILQQATHPSFTSRYRLELLEAAVCLHQNQDAEERIRSIVKKYYWVENNYLQATPKTEENVLQEIQGLADPVTQHRLEQALWKERLKEKQAVLDRIGASPKLLHFIAFVDDCVHIQDCRKQAVLRLNHFIFLYLRELAKRLEFDPELILYLLPSELQEFIKNPQTFTSVTSERQSGCLAVFDTEGMAVFSRGELDHVDVSLCFSDQSHLREAKGTPASVGVANGRVRVILGSDQFADFQNGEILVTNQTTPDFLPIMKRAAAIIAEQGGLTSHAAVISRELGTPCIVGVKDAMRIFKTGETVIVDATTGVIQKR